MRFPSKSARQNNPGTPTEEPRHEPDALPPRHPRPRPARRPALYGEVFGLSEGRSAEHWVDFDFFGHQLVIHQHPQTDSPAPRRQQPGGRPRRAGAALRRGPRMGRLARPGRTPAAARHPLRDRAPHPLQGPGRRAGHAVSLRPLRQRAGVQELPRHGPVVRQGEIAGAPPYCAQSVQNSSAAQLDCSSGRLDVAHSFFAHHAAQRRQLEPLRRRAGRLCACGPVEVGLEGVFKVAQAFVQGGGGGEGGRQARMSRRTR